MRRQTDGQRTEITKLTVAFQNSAIMPKIPNCHIESRPDIDIGYELYFDVYVNFILN
jgi:hypothetical protein